MVDDAGVQRQEAWLWTALLTATALRMQDAVRISLPDGTRLSSSPITGAGIDRADRDEVLERGVEAHVSAHPVGARTGRYRGPSSWTTRRSASSHRGHAEQRRHGGSALPSHHLGISTPRGAVAYAETEWGGLTMAVGDGSSCGSRCRLPCSVLVLAHRRPAHRIPARLGCCRGRTGSTCLASGCLPAARVYTSVEQASVIERARASALET